MNWLRRWLQRKPETLAQPTFPHLHWLLNSTWLAQAVYVAARLDIAEELRAGPKSADVLASKCGVQPDELMRVLRALAGFGIFSRDSQGRFSLTESALPLLHDNPHSIQAYSEVWGVQLYAGAGRLLEQLRTGEPGFKLQHGLPMWQHYEADAEAGALFDRFMSVTTDAHCRFIPKWFDFSKFQHVVDVGAGGGSLLSTVLHSNPKQRGTWYDRAEVLPLAQERIEKEGLGSRCELIAGDFLQSVPAGGDLYLIKHVLHDWEDSMATRIVANIAEAMSKDSKLLIIGGLLDETNNRDGLCKLRDLEQMFWTGGRVRTRSDFERLLHPAGMHITATTQTPIVDVCIIEVSK
ncbi:methyltransferase [Allorhodopirellula heiligendammensis]|uniref:Multifunctional cyclase-dehydratase-3-O-methyl transferase TcmN n=1 Tax=Allorhodopirellula heiligendammensis TaxID=2714739 RepID=A0A5C6C542_9BACT|nr:methyltransferase [Allorhodopirellula heiligendammensis]TWU18661.1 Multifunctional cyclase-dehydratase-3-O-methyl transferase TcmN [Allorhodopirellula heiligendammensis]